MDNTRNKVRPIYSELQGFLLAAPDPNKTSRVRELSLGQKVNQSIIELNEITGKNYDKYKIENRHEIINRTSAVFINPREYQSQLTSLIQKLKGEYFYDEVTGNGPNTVINQTQFQSQQQSIVVELALTIAEKKADYPTGTPERTFLDALGEKLKTTKTISEVIATILDLATKAGVWLDFLLKIFGR